jgi:transcriptional regulator with XRE-family HTH domain
MLLAERVRAARRERGWTREMLAVYAGVSATTVARIERGEHIPRPATLMALARALDLPGDELAASVGMVIHPMDPNDKWAR